VDLVRRAVAAALGGTLAILRGAGLGCKAKADRPVAGLLAAGAALHLSGHEGPRARDGRQVDLHGPSDVALR
jgi:hypothetical protein